MRYLDPLKRILGYVLWSLREFHEKIGGSDLGLHKYKINAHYKFVGHFDCNPKLIILCPTVSSTSEGRIDEPGHGRMLGWAGNHVYIL